MSGERLPPAFNQRQLQQHQICHCVTVREKLIRVGLFVTGDKSSICGLNKKLLLSWNWNHFPTCEQKGIRGQQGHFNVFISIQSNGHHGDWDLWPTTGNKYQCQFLLWNRWFFHSRLRLVGHVPERTSAWGCVTVMTQPQSSKTI